MNAGAPPRVRRGAIVPPEVLADVAASAAEVDAEGTDLRPRLRQLASAGLADLGLPGSSGTLADQVGVLATLAGTCMATAFSLWAHRMATEYVVVHGGDVLAGRYGPALRSGDRPGSTALAGALRAASGLADLPVEAASVPERGTVRLTGTIAWASNLYNDAVIVTAARFDGDRAVVVVVPVATPGVRLSPAPRLLALDASRSGAVHLDGAEVDADHVFPVRFAGFLDAIRPAFLSLQSALCLGLGRAALDAAPAPSGANEVFAPDVASLRAGLDAAEQQLARFDTDRRSLLELRLRSAHLAQSATRLELALTGGRGYVAAGPTARRLRESLFLPVQSPTEGHLRWELSCSG